MTFQNPEEESHSPLQPQVVIYGDLDILIGSEISFRRLDRRMPEQEFDLLEVPAILPAQFGAGTTKVMGSKMFDPDLLR